MTTILQQIESSAAAPVQVNAPLGGRRRLHWDVTDSIDMMPVNNKILLARNAARNRSAGRPSPKQRSFGFFGVTGRTFAAVITTVVTGLLIAFTAWLMEAGIDVSVSWRNALLKPAILAQGPLAGAGVHVAIGASATLFTAAIVQLLAPGAAGAGVSLVMAFLNGNNITGLFTPTVYAVKIVGHILARMAALALGPEAPMIHLGACIASMTFGLERRWWARHLKLEKFDKADAEITGLDAQPAFDNISHREIISAGAAAGLAAAFGAPIGGVLFALEEACSVWSRKTAWRCLLCTATAVFTMSQLMPSVMGGGILSLSGIYPLSSRQWLKQLPFVILVSAGAGLLGATFNLLRVGMQRLRAARRHHSLRLLEAALVATITAGVIAAASARVGRCLAIPTTWEAKETVQYTCPDGQYNDLATALLGSSPFVVRGLLGLGSDSEPINANSNNLCTLDVPCYYSVASLVALCGIYLVLMVLSAGLAVPGGLFMPSIIVGGSFGAVSGMLLTAVLPSSWDVQPGVYAMVGATATMAAVFRSSISLVVIVVEGTRGIDFLPGILAATIVSNFIAHVIHRDGVYESELERDGRVFFLRQEPPGTLRWRTAESMMASPVVGLPQVVEVSRVVDVLRSEEHNGFPVSSGEDPSQASRLDGFILRTQLLVLLQERAFCDANGQYLETSRSGAAAYEARLDFLMRKETISSDGLGETAEIAVDPLGPTVDDEDEEAVSLAMMHTLETLSKLPGLTEILTDRSNMPGNPAPVAVSPEPNCRDGARSASRFRPLQLPERSLSYLYLNLGPFMDQGMMAVRPNTPASTVHQMFVALSLRHLCVTTAEGRVLGIITRKDLDNAAGHGWWRANAIAPSPTRAQPVLHKTSWLHSLFMRMTTSSTATSVAGGSSIERATVLAEDALLADDELLEEELLADEAVRADDEEHTRSNVLNQYEAWV